jgi:hypothetical protein
MKYEEAPLKCIQFYYKRKHFVVKHDTIQIIRMKTKSYDTDIIRELNSSGLLRIYLYYMRQKTGPSYIT